MTKILELRLGSPDHWIQGARAQAPDREICEGPSYARCRSVAMQIMVARLMIGILIVDQG